MATLVTFHAHPDDEAIATGGVMAKAAQEGHRVVLVLGTKGEHGEYPDDFLKEGEELGPIRVVEQEKAAELLGVSTIHYLGYVDSGMMGTPENDKPGSFWSADLDEAAKKLATILDEENADILTIYDANGSYGHPDHIQVHRIGLRAADIRPVKKLYESVTSQEDMKRWMEVGPEFGLDFPDDIDLSLMGVPAATITTEVDVREFIGVKRAAMRAHASQMPENVHFFWKIPDDIFELAFGKEQFVLRDAPPGTKETDLFQDL
jgi:LmbE family N-acetylglucosaminyl deacetylase